MSRDSYKLNTCFNAGTIRYWPSIAHESSYSEVSADLQGQECATLTDIQPVGSVLSTTTSTIGLVHNECF